MVGRLENGYHEVRMIMQTIGLYDELYFEAFDTDSTDPRERIRLRCCLSPENREGFEVIRSSFDGKKTELSDNAGITDDISDNLIFKAATKLLPRIPEGKGIDIKLFKHIPMAAGMAGGSTDAAAALHGINELFSLGLTDGYLCEIGVSLGADIPYCIVGGTMLAEGIGEKLTRLPGLPKMHLVIAKPEESVSTKYAYETLDSLEKPYHPDVDGMMKIISSGNAETTGRLGSAEGYKDADGISFEALISGYLGNSLESVTIPACPKVQRIKSILSSKGATGTLMSGSGPTVFAIFASRDDAEKAAKSLADEREDIAADIFVTDTI